MSYRKSAGNAVFLIDKIPNTTVNAPVVAVGKVVETNTGDREATQDPMTGFLCDGTPLGKGHIIALFLGGPDIPENYAPQYEQWQQGGAWKKMETDILDLAKAAGNSVDVYMVVRLTYGNTGNIYTDEKTRFSDKKILPGLIVGSRRDLKSKRLKAPTTRLTTRSRPCLVRTRPRPSRR
jgi:hypothetical protein